MTIDEKIANLRKDLRYYQSRHFNKCVIDRTTKKLEELLKEKEYEENLADEFDARVWRALENIANDYPYAPDDMHQRCMEKAIKHFMTQFYNLDAEEE